MPTTPGFIIAASSGAKFTTAFTVDDLMYSFAGAFVVPVPGFDADDVELAYTAASDLTAGKAFTGVIGSNNVRLEFENGPVLTGTLREMMGTAMFVQGKGVWTQV